MQKNKGFTLVELIVAMAIFIVVMMIASTAFDRIVRSSGQQLKSAESNIEGIVGLEMARYDIEHAGYGLPFRFQNYSGAVKYSEVDVANEFLAKGIDSNSFNAARTWNIRAIETGTCSKEVNNSGVTNAGGGPDYLVIRSTVADISKASRKWTYVNYSANGTTNENLSYLKRWNTSEDFDVNDRIVVIRSTYSTSGVEDKTLLMNGNAFEVALSTGLVLPAGSSYKPADASEQVVAYGVRSGTLRAPYNRTDFYVKRPTDMPQECNAGTGILYKAVADHAGGFSQYPLLDCVADMQVEFELDTSGTEKLGNSAYVTTLSGLSAADIRAQLRTVHVYILAQEGKKDKYFSYPGNSIHVGDPARATSGRTLSSDDMAALFGADWRNYRWKIYTIATRTKNVGQ